MKTLIRFIINPRSGTSGKTGIPEIIRKNLDDSRFDVDIRFTEAPRHATKLAKEASGAGAAIVVAVGGDGSVNETAAGLIGTNTALGILPCGSGNGLARHHALPLDLDAAVRALNDVRIIDLDTFTVGDHFAIGTFGIGFDAHIAHLFAKAKSRGYATYVKLVLSEFSSFKPLPMLFDVDGHVHRRDCFLLTFANSSQFGNNAVIAPFADMQDGFLDISMMSKFPAYTAPHLIFRLTHNTLHKSRFYDMIRGKEIMVRNDGTMKGHIDGEPVVLTGDFKVKLHSGSMKFVVPAQSSPAR